jgi:hypothetical protein
MAIEGLIARVQEGLWRFGDDTALEWARSWNIE